MSRSQPLAKLTTNAGETDLESLLSNDAVFVIPYFQRPYRWKPEKVQRLQDDLLNLVDESADVHFLGAVIIHGRRGNPSDPKFYEVIDGQQRITTVFLFICAIIKVMSKHGLHDDAAGLFSKYIAITRQTGLSSNSRLYSCKDDRAQLNSVIRDLLTDQALLAKIPHFNYVDLPVAGQSSKGPLQRNYRAAVRFVEQQAKEQPDLARVHALLDALVGRCTVVQIDVSDPASGPKIFDSLNSAQEPMTIGDLVRNEIFSRVANSHPEQIETIDAQFWQPFANGFKIDDKTNLFDEYFFPFGLIENPNLRKTEVYAKLREKWKTLQSPEQIIRSLERYQQAFLDLKTDENRQRLSPSLCRRFGRLYRAKAPTSTFPFLMQLSNALRDGQIGESDGGKILDVLESFLVRRAICGHEPTGLHAVFKRLWQDCDGRPTSEGVIARIRGHTTVTWPRDEEVRESICSRPLYEAGIVTHLLYSWCESVEGELPEFSDELQIEHVLPQSPDAEWFTQGFSRESFETQLHLLANLLLLTQPLNASLSNRPYAEKRRHYDEDASFKATREFAREFTAWTPADISRRSQTLADWAVTQWKY
jgi:hypothetical protein